MTTFRITVALLALLGCTWIIWDLRWRGVYIVAVIAAVVFVDRSVTQLGWNPLLPVLSFILLATLLGYRVFGRFAAKRR